MFLSGDNMLIPVFWAKCLKCKASFEFIADDADGMRILRSRKELIPAKVSWLNDTVFDEVGDIVEEYYIKSNLDPIEIARKFSHVFGRICDKAPDGSQYDMTGFLICPLCSNTFIDYGPFDPPKFIKEDEVPDVTHGKWDGMTDKEKRKTVYEILADLDSNT